MIELLEHFCNDELSNLFSGKLLMPTDSQSIYLRAANASDQAHITRLVRKNNLNPFGLAWHNFTIAIDEHEQFIGCGQLKEHDGIDELASLVVIDEAQGRGVSNILMKALLQGGKRPLWLMCESPLTVFYNKFGFEEITDPGHLPDYLRNMYWFTRVSFGLVFWLRGTHVAFMRLDD
jgi:amino-acid N-acetyltransferase